MDDLAVYDVHIGVRNAIRSAKEDVVQGLQQMDWDDYVRVREPPDNDEYADQALFEKLGYANVVEMALGKQSCSTSSSEGTSKANMILPYRLSITTSSSQRKARNKEKLTQSILLEVLKAWSRPALWIQSTGRAIMSMS